jgi:ABC-2 type transport system ATP-binding protein
MGDDGTGPLQPAGGAFGPRYRRSVPAIAVSDLVVRYPGTVAVDHLTLAAEAGQILALLGPNGAGKTTTVETLEGYRAPTEGSVRVLGLDPRADHHALTKRLGVMLQHGGVYPAMSPVEAVRLFAHYYDNPEEPDGLIFRVGLTRVARTPWRRLSGGEQQRLALALALVGRPWVVILDEPTAGVDPQGRLAIRGVIRELRAAGVCVLLTTHDLEEAERLADRIVIIDRGRVVAEGSPAQLMAHGGGMEIRFGAPPGLDAAALAARLGAAVAEERPGEYLVTAEARPATVAAITAWLAERDLPLADLRAGRERLEDVFLRLTGAQSAATEDRGPAPAKDRGRGRGQSRGPGRGLGTTGP